ncbi:hypothetical protein [uncultured Paracoccus sp.]|uniref:hypothetical protein n=1 Tax=uncultured Paracoccus sp. TaxID=189685 RepID=UPI00261395B4|nr:hypothetical protein [uncultured Paracoccus sp.]
MANADTPFGLRPVRHRNGAPYNGAATRYYVPASDSTALFIGDPVIFAGSADANGVASVTRASAAGGAYMLGPVVAVEPVTADSLPYRAASTERYVWVADDPDLVFEIQEDSVGGALAAADIGLNADIVIAAGSTATGRSGVELDTSTKATTNTLQLRILGLVQRPDNEVGANAKVLVTINLHSLRNLTGI